jgi:hypothetical protein
VDLAANERFAVTSYEVAGGDSCRFEIAAFSPPDTDGLEYFLYAGERYPFVWDSRGSPDTSNGGQLTFVARRAGTYRIAVRSWSGVGCGRYRLDMRRMRADTGTNAPPPYSW